MVEVEEEVAVEVEEEEEEEEEADKPPEMPTQGEASSLEENWPTSPETDEMWIDSSLISSPTWTYICKTQP